ncbi:MAG: beta-ketoacyl-ACP synthase III [Pseudomonadota bacterium]
MSQALQSRRAVVRGVGHYLPARRVENVEFEASLETNDAWIRSRTGIERRHLASQGETTSAMGASAARSALEDAELSIRDIDAIILATSTADYTFPSAATMIQNALGMEHGFAFDLQAVCAGFVFALSTANAMITSGQARRVVVIGAETFSNLMDWEDRTTCVLFGDGAGALVLEAQDAADNPHDRGILATELNSDGRYKDILYVDGGVSTGETGYLRMSGQEVFRHAVEKLSRSALDTLQAADVTPDDVTWIVPHQANIRILQAVSKRLGIPMERVVTTLQDHGNTSAASIPLALSVAKSRGQLALGDLVVTGAIGGGLAWGTVVLRW